MFMRGRAALLLTLLLVGNCPIASAEVAPQNGRKNGDSVRVTTDQIHQLRVMKAELHPFRVQKFAVGQIAYNEDTSTAVLTPFSGRVTRLVAKVGDKVKRGETLFEIDSPEVVQPQNDFIAAVTALNKARSQLDLALIVEKRLKDLYEGKAAALKEWQQAEAQLDAARNDVRSAEISLEAVRARLRIVGFTDEEIAALQGKGSIRRATPITAPIDGTVIARKVGPGQYVRNDTGDALYVVADLTTMWLKAQVPENDIPLVRVGQEVEVKVSALPGRVFKARIAAIGAGHRIDDAAHRRSLRNPQSRRRAQGRNVRELQDLDRRRRALARGSGRGRDPRRRSRDRLGRGGADAVRPAQGEARDGAGWPGADPRRPRGRRAHRRPRRDLHRQRVAAVIESRSPHAA